MPGAPASTQTRTASSTLGTVPPRELRSVATLLTLTESLSHEQPDVFTDRASAYLRRHDFLRHRFDLLLSWPSSITRSSGSVPEYRTSSRPLPPSRSSTSFDDHGDLWNRLQIDSSAHADVHQHLRIRRADRRRDRQLPSRRRHRPQHIQRRNEAVAGEQIVREDQMPGLLAAERQVPLLHLFHDVLVADSRCEEARCLLSSAPARGRCCSSRSRPRRRRAGALRPSSAWRT